MNCAIQKVQASKNPIPTVNTGTAFTSLETEETIMLSYEKDSCQPKSDS